MEKLRVSANPPTVYKSVPNSIWRLAHQPTNSFSLDCVASFFPVERSLQGICA